MLATQDYRSFSKLCCSTGHSSTGDLVLYPESQTRQFQDFLTRANRYPSLVVGGVSGSGGGVSNRSEKKIVLVEVIRMFELSQYTLNSGSSSLIFSSQQ